MGSSRPCRAWKASTTLLLWLLLCPASAFLDPLSLGTAAGVAAFCLTFGRDICGGIYSTGRDAAWSGQDFVRKTYSKISGHCPDQDSPNEASLRLARLLEKNLFGQHIAQDILKNAAGFRKRKKALVMSFQGWTGSGKNLAAILLAEAAFPPDGIRNEHVHLFISTVDFPVPAKAEQYKVELNKRVREGLSRCPRSIFIFDEVDKIPQGVLDSIRPYLDFHQEVNGLKINEATFLFLSNSGGRQIIDHAHSHWKAGKAREDLDYKSLQQLLMKTAFKEGDGGLRGSWILDSSLVDHFVPFLPLHKDHVMQCVKAEMAEALTNLGHGGPFLECMTNLMFQDKGQEVADSIIFWPEEAPLFSTTGCKRIHILVSQYDYLSQGYKEKCDIPRGASSTNHVPSFFSRVARYFGGP